MYKNIIFCIKYALLTLLGWESQEESHMRPPVIPTLTARRLEKLVSESESREAVL